MHTFDEIFNNDSPAIIFKDDVITYKELYRNISSATNLLIEKGVKENDNVVLLGKNSSAFIALIFAVWEIGAIPVPINFNLAKNEIKQIIDLVSPKIVLADDELNNFQFPNYPDCINYPFEYTEGENKLTSGKKIDLEKPALISFTSGTSGKPKGVKLSFGNLFKSAESQNNFLKLKQNDKYLAALPFYHIGGFSIITRTSFSKGTVVIPGSLKTKIIIKNINKHRPKSISLVQTQLKRLLDSDFVPPKNLENILIGGSFIDNNLINEAIKKGWKLIKVYGSTETCSFITAKKIESENDISNSSGGIVGENEVKIIDGRIAVKGESVMQGYLNQQTSFKDDGFFVTEDIGHFANNNELIIVGRSDDIIFSGGENISLIEIEYYVKQFKKIKDAVVLGMKDEEWGEIVSVVAVTFENKLFPLTDLNQSLSKNLARYKLPKKIFFVDEIPRNEMGKVLKEKLLEIITP